MALAKYTKQQARQILAVNGITLPQGVTLDDLRDEDVRMIEQGNGAPRWLRQMS